MTTYPEYPEYPETYPEWIIHGVPCSECGGCDYYCADCLFPQLFALKEVAKVARGVVSRMGDPRESITWAGVRDSLADALDTLDGKDKDL